MKELDNYFIVHVSYSVEHVAKYCLDIPGVGQVLHQTACMLYNIIILIHSEKLMREVGEMSL